MPIFKELVEQEKQDAREIYGEFNSMHEIYGVLAEELHEFFLQVATKPDERNSDNILQELTQIASTVEMAAEDLYLVEKVSTSPNNFYKEKYEKLADIVKRFLIGMVVINSENQIQLQRNRINTTAAPSGFDSILIKKEILQELELSIPESE